MKFKLSAFFTLAAILLAVVMCLNIAHDYISLRNCAACSAPAWVAFYLAIPYGIAIVACLLTAWILHRRGK